MPTDDFLGDSSRRDKYSPAPPTPAVTMPMQYVYVQVGGVEVVVVVVGGAYIHIGWPLHSHMTPVQAASYGHPASTGIHPATS